MTAQIGTLALISSFFITLLARELYKGTVSIETASVMACVGIIQILMILNLILNRKEPNPVSMVA